MPNRSLSSVMYDPGGLALPAPTDPGGLAIPQPGIDPGGMALPVPGPMDPGGMALPAPQAPQAALPSWQNPAAAMAPGAIANAPRIFGNTLYEHGNTRELQPHELAAGQGYVEDFWRQFGDRGGQVWGSGHQNDPYANPAIGFPEGRGPAFGEGPPGMPPGFEKMGGPPGIDWNSHLNPDGSLRTPTDVPLYQPGPWQTMGGGLQSSAGGSYATFTSGPHRPGSMRPGTPIGSAVSGAFPSPVGSAAAGLVGLFGGRGGRGGGGFSSLRRNGNRTLADVTASPVGMDSSYVPPLEP